MIRILIMMSCLWLSACQTYHFSNAQPELSFVHLEPIPVNVQYIEIINHYQQSPNDQMNQAYALNDSPRETLADLIQSKIIPTLKTHSKSHLKFYIIEAKITQNDTNGKTVLEGVLNVHVETFSIEKEFTDLKDFEIYAAKEAPLGITLATKEDLIFALNETLMQKFYTAFLDYKDHSMTTL